MNLANVSTCMFFPQKAVGLETSAHRPAAAKPTQASQTSKPEAAAPAPCGSSYTVHFLLKLLEPLYCI